MIFLAEFLFKPFKFDILSTNAGIGKPQIHLIFIKSFSTYIQKLNVIRKFQRFFIKNLAKSKPKTFKFVSSLTEGLTG